MSVACWFVIINSISVMVSKVVGLSILGVFLFVLGCFVLMIVQFLYPAILAERITSGCHLVTAVQRSVMCGMKYPWRMVGLNLLPGFLKNSIILTILLQVFSESGISTLFLGMISLAVVVCIEASFWFVWNKNDAGESCSSGYSE